MFCMEILSFKYQLYFLQLLVLEGLLLTGEIVFSSVCVPFTNLMHWDKTLKNRENNIINLPEMQRSYKLWNRAGASNFTEELDSADSDSSLANHRTEDRWGTGKTTTTLWLSPESV